MDPESSVQPSDLGMEYQYQVITSTAAQLSQNQHVKDYIIYSNVDEAIPLDDMILKIWFKNKKHPHVYMVQVKHKLEKSINISDTAGQSNVSRYFDIYKKIITSKDKFTFLNEVKNYDIRFWLYCNKNIEEVSVFRKKTFIFKCDFSRISYADRTIIPFETIRGCCYNKLSLPSVEIYPNISLVSSEDYENFFNKCYLILNQPGINEIDSDIKKYCELPESRTIYRYVHEYFNNTEISLDGLSKNTFETELLKIHLHDYIPSFTRIIEIDGEEANNFIGLVTESNVTLVNKLENIGNSLYSCCLRRINQVLCKDFTWCDILSKDGHLIDGVTSEEFKEYAKKKQRRQWLTEPKTISSLLIELWVYDELPLILETDSELTTTLNKYKHLNKKFIVIGDVEKKNSELRSIFTNIFTNMADIQDILLRNNYLECISVSLQGKPPVSLSAITSDEDLCIKELNCSEILHLITKRKAYLDETRLNKTDSIVFVIQDENSQKEWNIDEILPKNNVNTRIYCTNIKENSTHIEEHIRNNSKFENYTTCSLRLFQGKFELLGGNISKMRNYFVDENGDSIYIDGINQKIIPVIGQKLGEKPSIYLSRCFCETEILNNSLKTKSIYFLSGDVSSLRAQEKIFDGNTEIDLEVDRNILVNTGTDSIEKYWKKFSSCQRPQLHVKVIDGCLKILDHKNCNLDVELAQSKTPFEEKDFLKVTKDSKVTIIVGDQGTGKSTLLDSLSLLTNKSDYVLFCKLVDYEKELTDRNKKLLESPLDYIFNKFECSTLKKFLNPVCNHHKTTGRLIIFIDALDEVLPLCEDAILIVIKRIVECEVRVIIASRFLTHAYLINNLSINNIQVRSIKLCDLQKEDSKEFFKLKGATDFNVDVIDKDFLINPSYLSYLHFYHQEKPLDFRQINKFGICKMIILKIIEDYYRKIKWEYEPTEENEAQNEDILNSHRLMAMIAYFGKDFIIQHCNVKQVKYNKSVETFKQMDIKLGLVRDFKDDSPVFVNDIFVQFLVMEWFNKRRGKLNVALKEAYDNFSRRILLES